MEMLICTYLHNTWRNTHVCIDFLWFSIWFISYIHDTLLYNHFHHFHGLLSFFKRCTRSGLFKSWIFRPNTAEFPQASSLRHGEQCLARCDDESIQTCLDEVGSCLKEETLVDAGWKQWKWVMNPCLTVIPVVSWSLKFVVIEFFNSVQVVPLQYGYWMNKTFTHLQLKSTCLDYHGFSMYHRSSNHQFPPSEILGWCFSSSFCFPRLTSLECVYGQLQPSSAAPSFPSSFCGEVWKVW